MSGRESERHVETEGKLFCSLAPATVERLPGRLNSGTNGTALQGSIGPRSV